MKFLLAFVGLVVLASQGAESARATLEELKAFEKFSPYPWTQWLKFHPGSAAAVAIAPNPGQFSYSGPDPEELEGNDDTEEDESAEPTDEELAEYFKRATLPEADPKGAKAKADKATAKALKEQAKLAKKAEKAAAAALTTKKPSILDLEPDFWGPPPSIAPNVTVPPPPGYWASKKALFISKLFAALADSVLNSTGPPTPLEVTTTTPSPRQALLDELNNVLLNDQVRSVAPAASSDSDESDESEESDEDSDEVKASVHVVTPAPKPTKLDFLGKLSSAIAAKPPKPTKAPSPWAWGKPTKAPKKSKKLLKGKKGKGKPTPAPAGLDYDALAKALLANGASSPSAPASKSKKA